MKTLVDAWNKYDSAVEIVCVRSRARIVRDVVMAAAIGGVQPKFGDKYVIDEMLIYLKDDSRAKKFDRLSLAFLAHAYAIKEVGMITSIQKVSNGHWMHMLFEAIGAARQYATCGYRRGISDVLYAMYMA